MLYLSIAFELWSNSSKKKKLRRSFDLYEFGTQTQVRTPDDLDFGIKLIPLNYACPIVLDNRHAYFGRIDLIV